MRMEMPLVSVVVPVYNVEKYLDRCVSSIVNQTYENLEILLIDDGSPDSSGSMCDAWARRDSRIRVIHKQNAGAGMARNTGLDHAGGDYVCFVDSDDYIHTDTVEKCVRQIADAAADVLIFGKHNVFEDGSTECVPISGEQRRFHGQEVTHTLLPAMFTYDLGFGISVWGKFFVREAIERNKIRFLSERNIGSEDALFNMMFFSQIGSAAVLPENLYYYFENTSSFSRTYRADRQEKNDVFLKSCMEYVQKNNLPDVLLRHMQVRYHGYSFAALKHIMKADLCLADKRAALRNIYTSQMMRATLSNDVIRMEKRTLQLFWRLIRIKWFWVCDILLWVKTGR